jgi:hypothetical protein
MDPKTVEAGHNAGTAGKVGKSKLSAESSKEESPKAIRECPEDYLTPLDMVTYIRALEDDVELPLDVSEHLQSCKACNATWDFVQATDPVFRKFRKQRVEALIHQFEKDKKFTNHGSVHVKNRREERTGSLQADQEIAIDTIAGRYEKEIQADVAEGGYLSLDWLFEQCAKVQQIEEVQARFLKANAFARALDAVFFADIESKPNTREIVRSIVIAPSETFDLTKLTEHQAKELPKGLRSVVELGVAFLMRSPSVSYFPSGSILERSESSILFHRDAFDRYRNEFKKLSTSDSVSPVYSRL